MQNAIQQSLLDSVKETTTKITKMSEENQSHITQIKEEMSTFQNDTADIMEAIKNLKNIIEK